MDMDISENPSNQALCHDMMDTISQRDVNGKGKYFINESNQIEERAGWKA
jgi:hypothetical protein